jgi:acyl transferase domain-containing protein/acyl carrier protein
VVFVFPGQGSQWRAMGRGLLGEEAFAEPLRRCDALIGARLGWSLLDELARDPSDSRLHTTLIAQPAIFALQVALTALLARAGVVPHAVVGHSVGEVAAAHVAGVLSLEDAVHVICAQNRVMAEVIGRGRMLFVAQPAGELAGVLERHPGVALASSTSPRSCVLSGGDELREIGETIAARGIFTRLLNVDIAFHGPQIEPHVAPLAASTRGVATRAATLPIYSTLRGAMARPGDYDGDYWGRHMRVPVRFAEAVAAAIADGHDVFLEVGPHPVLAQAVEECAGGAAVSCLGTLRRDQPETRELLGTLARLERRGVAVDWSRFGDGDRAGAHARLDDEARGRAASPGPADVAPAVRRARLERLIREIVTDVGGGAIDAEAASDDTRGFFDLGFDSTMTVRLAERLSSALGLALAPTIAFDHSNVAALARHLEACLGGEAQPAASPSVVTTAPASRRDDPIAVVGMACRFPGGANDVDAYWDLLVKGRDAVSEIPRDRFDVDAFFDPDPDTPGRTYSRWGGFLGGVRLDEFDAAFFNIPPAEARALDPQQRLLLEVTWEALEHAGIAPRDLRGRPVGVFVGLSTDDYKAAHLWSGDPARIDGYSALGSMPSAAGGRISYLLGLRGPNLAVDTACSSSLVALHLACQSLGSGESEAALVAGANTITSPYLYVYFSKLRALSPDGRCQTFSDAANGYTRAEGCGALVLKRLSRARADGDRVLALVAGTAVNQDGASTSFTAPSGVAQEEVIRGALAAAGVSALDVQYVEAHGTGTPLGDPIEVASLTRTYGSGRDLARPLLVGSVKANVGHLEAAAGLAGLVKIVLALQHETLPPHRLVGRPNARVPWSEIPIRVPTEPVAWPRGERPRLAALSSFGFSGTNAHVVVADAPVDEAAPSAARRGRGRHALALSARETAALREVAARYERTLMEGAAPPLADVCFTANTGRDHFPRRLLATGTSPEEIGERLAAFREGRSVPGLVVGEPAPGRGPGVAFVFSGQGSQYAGMGRALYETEPVFRSVLDRCSDRLGALRGRSLIERLYGADADDAALAETEITQPALFAFEYALARTWMSWGIVPVALIGHSVGEYVAACLAGVFTLEDGLALIARRGALMQSLPRDGAMTALFCSEDRARAWLAGDEARVAIAAVNAAESVVISGERSAVGAVTARAERDGVRARPLRVSHAFHSPLMTPMLDAFRRGLASVPCRPPAIPLASNVTGRLAAGDDLTHPEYWCRHAREAVRFSDGVAALARAGHGVFLEIGPAAALAALGPQIAPEALWLASLRRGAGDETSMLEALGRLYVRGLDVDWKAFAGAGPHRKVALPTYPFQRRRHWMAHAPAPAAAAPRASGGDAPHPVLGRRIASPALGETVVFESTLSSERPAWLADHRLFGRVVAPAAVELALLLCAATQGLTPRRSAVRDVAFSTPLALPADGALTVQLIVERPHAGEAPFRIVARPAGAPDEPWHTHCSGTFVTASGAARVVEAPGGRRSPPESAAPFYERLDRAGRVGLGPTFRSVDRVQHGDGEALCAILPGTVADAAAYDVHPRVIDALLQSIIFAFRPMMEAFAAGRLWLPQHAAALRFHGPRGSAGLRAHARLIDVRERFCKADLALLDEHGHAVLEIDGLTAAEVDLAAIRRAIDARDIDRLLYVTAWRERPGARGEAIPSAGGRDGGRPDALVVFADGEVASTAARVLERREAPWVLVSRGACFERPGPSRFTVAPDSRDDVRRVLGGLAEDAAGALRVVYLWGLSPDGALDPEALAREHRAVCGGLLHLVQALADVPGARLHVATTETHAAAPLTGMARALALEHPELFAGAIDVDDPGDARAIELLVDECLSGRDADRVRVVGGVRHEARLERLTLGHDGGATPPVRADATYLITGGLGALGLASAGWLVARGARHVVLAGRHPDRADALARIASLRSGGADVIVRRLDVADDRAVARLVAEIGATMPPLRGVIHAAGTLDDGAFLQQSWARYDAVLAPKTRGAMALHRATEALELDFFVLFSSAVTALGQGGQGSYAAANAFLDALARSRHARGLPCLAVDWGPWRDAGMATADVRRAALEARGIRALDPDRCLEAMGVLLAHHGPPAVGVLDVDWPTLVTPLPAAQRAYYADLASVSDAPARAEASGAPADVLARALEAAPAGERAGVIRRVVAEVVGAVLGLDADARLDETLPLMEQGLDSLMAVELRRQLERASGTPVPVGVMFSHPTIDDLSRYLAERVPAAGPPAAPAWRHPPGSAETGSAFAHLDALSPEELDALIRKELERTA